MHTSAQRLEAATDLPDRGPKYHLKRLQSGRKKVQRCLGHPALDVEDLGVLKSIVSQCDRLESRWGTVEQICECVPSTLIHGDFSEKNLRVRTRQDGIALGVFDWECAGWGTPAPDLAQCAPEWTGLSANPDMTAYWSTVRDRWQGLDMQTVQQLSAVGVLFRTLAAISWAARSLSCAWPQRTMAHLAIFQRRLLEARLVVD
jgi:aminoglycoside phosphotransferase (APT) family kinase protein